MTIERLLDARRALDAGDLDAAERIYHQVVGVDPRSSMAIAGLAQVARDRGDDTAAIRLARQALAIDPANATALRLVGAWAGSAPRRHGQAEAAPLPDGHAGSAPRLHGQAEAARQPDGHAGSPPLPDVHNAPATPDNRSQPATEEDLVERPVQGDAGAVGADDLRLDGWLVRLLRRARRRG